MQILNAVDILRCHALFFHKLFVVWHIVPDVLDLLNKSFALELFHVLVCHALDLFVPIFSHWNTPPVFMIFGHITRVSTLCQSVKKNYLSKGVRTLSAPTQKHRIIIVPQRTCTCIIRRTYLQAFLCQSSF